LARQPKVADNIVLVFHQTSDPSLRFADVLQHNNLRSKNALSKRQA